VECRRNREHGESEEARLAGGCGRGSTVRSLAGSGYSLEGALQGAPPLGQIRRLRVGESRHHAAPQVERGCGDTPATQLLGCLVLPQATGAAGRRDVRQLGLRLVRGWLGIQRAATLLVEQRRPGGCRADAPHAHGPVHHSDRGEDSGEAGQVHHTQQAGQLQEAGGQPGPPSSLPQPAVTQHGHPSTQLP